jgi:uncharacterized membrane protein YbaN (DUF454 family)
MRVFWILVGGLSTACGVAGLALPLVPTTPFLLLAAFAFARSSPRLHAKLLAHPQFGPIITNWNRDGSIDRRSKTFALLMMAACIMISLYLRVPAYVMVIQLGILGAVALFIVTRPSGPGAAE